MVAKLEPRRVAGFLADPPSDCRVVLLIGDDAGLVTERAGHLVRAVAGDDPICISEPPRDAARDAGFLAGEAASVPLMGGRMAIRLRDARDAWAEAVKAALAGPGPGLVIIEGAGVTGKSKLKALVAADPRGQVIECYAERGRDLTASITRILGELGATADAAALEWLTERAGEDRLAMRRALEVLALHAVVGARITVEDAMELLGEGSVLDLDEALMAASLGEIAVADRAMAKAFGEGANPVQVLRAALRHTHRLHLARLAMEGGSSAEDAVSALRPPVFWKAKPAMARALGRWSVARLEALGTALLRAERQAKSTGLPDETIARHVVLGLARSAAR